MPIARLQDVSRRFRDLLYTQGKEEDQAQVLIYV